jgi:hypothetical protein
MVFFKHAASSRRRRKVQKINESKAFCRLWKLPSVIKERDQASPDLVIFSSTTMIIGLDDNTHMKRIS